MTELQTECLASFQTGADQGDHQGQGKRDKVLPDIMIELTASLEMHQGGIQCLTDGFVALIRWGANGKTVLNERDGEETKTGDQTGTDQEHKR